MNNSFYNDFAARFAASTLPSLVRSFNSQVGKRGFNSVRAAHDQALIDELVRAHPINQGDYAYSFVSLKRKNFISVTPLKAALNALILALNDSAKALVALLTKKFKTSS